jgi:hypothetical protein
MKYFALLLSACVAPVPQDVDHLAHHLWRSFDADDATIREGLLAWHSDETGSISRAPELTKGRGFFFYNAVDCSIDQMEAIFAAPDQATIFGDTYDAYARTFSNDLEAYVARTIQPQPAAFRQPGPITWLGQSREQAL